MKNIHVLPTDKSSRLSITDGILILHRLQWRKGTQNIYITNDEEIKEGDYMINPLNYIYHVHDEWMRTLRGFKTEEYRKKWQKIILTTDQDLIKDGVQSIPDEFLEWFVKNPSCEKVEVEDYPMVEKYSSKGEYIHNNYWTYKITIPKEEPNIIDQWLEKNGNPEIAKQVEQEAEELCKQQQKKILIEMMQEDEELGLYDKPKQQEEFCHYSGLPSPAAYVEESKLGTMSEAIKQVIDNQLKQETLEEAAERLSGLQEGTYTPPHKITYKHGFIDGAKWQQERTYSEVFEWLANKDYLSDKVEGIQKEFEQFKTK